MEKRTLIEIKNLVKRFGDVRVIDDLTLNFHAGERVALIGQNGAGKTTLIRSILGLYTYEGYLRVLGSEPRKHRQRILMEVGFVPQLPPPLRMTVSEILDFFSRIFNTDKQVFIDLANRLNLDVEKHVHKPFLKLSGGMKQKLLVSLALGHNPQILLMDEPSANLDPEARKVFFGMLKEYRADSLMILSSHRTDEIKGLINRVVEMDLGKVILDEPFATVEEKL